MNRDVMKLRLFVLICGLLLGFVSATAQEPVATENRYERVLAIVPMVGEGTYEDPRRPMFAPAPAETVAKIRAARVARQSGRGDRYAPDTEILGYRFEESDDGRFALVEFTARDYRAFQKILDEQKTRPAVKVFRRGFAKRSEIENELRKHRRSFKLDDFAGVRP
jgi:hypothetical protein